MLEPELPGGGGGHVDVDHVRVPRSPPVVAGGSTAFLPRVEGSSYDPRVPQLRREEGRRGKSFDVGCGGGGSGRRRVVRQGIAVVVVVALDLQSRRQGVNHGTGQVGLPRRHRGAGSSSPLPDLGGSHRVLAQEVRMDFHPEHPPRLRAVDPAPASASASRRPPLLVPPILLLLLLPSAFAFAAALRVIDGGHRETAHARRGRTEEKGVRRRRRRPRRRCGDDDADRHPSPRRYRSSSPSSGGGNK
mmetsp:Transcript_30834/g.92377  ORF Transcript_30834/g.92377 Transcript_30834/m.92377 type:complete len:246 (-) Transcript_30834:72-809(-)